MCGSTLTPRAAGVIASAAAFNSSMARKGAASSSGSGARSEGAAAAAAAGGAGGSAEAACEALAAALPLRLGGMLRASQQERKGVCVLGGDNDFTFAVTEQLTAAD
jgi:hypothetical protein